MPKLGVNIDHVATLRQARRELDPDPIAAARLCEAAGADSIVAHLREDRRHIQDKDIAALRKCVKTRFNLEMSVHPDIVGIALRIRPDQATLVPERRQEITTEGGLNVVKYFKRIHRTTALLHKKRIVVSLFIAPSKIQIYSAYDAGARVVEFHTGAYANAKGPAEVKRETARLKEAVALAQKMGISVNAGHGLNYDNVRAVAQIPGIDELNIGHAIISKAIFTGLNKAVSEMKKLIH